MAEVIMYTSGMCGYCSRAEALLNKKGAEVKKVRVDTDPEMFREMLQKAHGRRTVPQIFIDDRHIGGYDDLVDLDMDGELDPLLGNTG